MKDKIDVLEDKMARMNVREWNVDTRINDLLYILHIEEADTSVLDSLLGSEQTTDSFDISFDIMFTRQKMEPFAVQWLGQNGDVKTHAFIKTPVKWKKIFNLIIKIGNKE